MDPRHRSFFNEIQVKILESKFLVEFRFGEKRNNERFDLSPGYYNESFFCLADEIPKKFCRMSSGLVAVHHVILTKISPATRASFVIFCIF